MFGGENRITLPQPGLTGVFRSQHTSIRLRSLGSSHLPVKNTFTLKLKMQFWFAESNEMSSKGLAGFLGGDQAPVRQMYKDKGFAFSQPCYMLTRLLYASWSHLKPWLEAH